MLEQDFFETAKANDYEGIDIEQFKEVEGNHGRIETRQYGVSPIPDYFTKTERWAGLKAMVMLCGNEKLMIKPLLKQLIIY